MNRNEIVDTLKNLEEEFNELLSLFDAPKDDLSKQETLNYISTKYSGIKTRVVEYHDKLEKAEKSGKLNEDELAFLAPAIDEVSSHCKAPKNSKNVHALSSSIFDGQSYCSYWLSELNA